MKPFAFLAARPSSATDICADEFAVVKRDGSLADTDVVHIFLEDDPEVNLDDFSGLFLSGSQYGFNDADESKSPQQITTERRAIEITAEAIERDFPFLGLCYGHQAIAVAAGVELTTRFFEELSVVNISLSDAGRSDPLFRQLPDQFPVILGHSEAFGEIPPNTVVLASSVACPVQAVRTGHNVYGTQYHPEIDAASMELRLEYYSGSKYFDPQEADLIRASALGKDFSAGARFIRAFVDQYRT